jgi:hypothetical protein
VDVLKVQFVPRKVVTEHTQLSLSTLLRLRKKEWEKGVHFTKVSSCTVRYNLPMILNWMALRHDPEAHARVVAEFKANLNVIN